MARPLSEEKRQAILNASATVLSDQGIGAPTSRIAREAGVAEGTVFKYFTNKEQLLNELYVVLKRDIAFALLSDYPANDGLKAKTRHVWMNYIDWAVRNMVKRRAVQQLGVWQMLSDDSRLQAKQTLSELDGLLDELAEKNGRLSPAFITAIMTSLAETTVDFAISSSDTANDYSVQGFDSFWRAVT